MPAPLLVAGTALAGFVKGGGLQGIIGGGARRKEERDARIEQQRRQAEYENFDYNQDVGFINDPYANIAREQRQFQDEQLARTGAQAINIGQRAGDVGSAQRALYGQTRAQQQAAQGLSQIRAQGARFVEQQRQQRISDRYDQAETFLARADYRLAEAKRARTTAQQALVKGIASGAIAGAGAATAGPDASFGDALRAGGVLPSWTASGGKIGTTDVNGKQVSNKLIQENPQRFVQGKDGNIVDLSETFQTGNNLNVTATPLDVVSKNYTPSVGVGNIQLGSGHGYENPSQYGF